MNFCDDILRHAREQPDHPALIEGERSLSYRELAATMAQWAAGLTDLGLQPGERLGVCLRDSTDFALAMLGSAWAGVTWVPLDWRAPDAEKARLATYFDLSAILVESGSRLISERQTVVIDEHWHRRVRQLSATSAPMDAADIPLMFKLSSGTTGQPKAAIAHHADMQGRLARNIVTYGEMGGYRYLSVLPLCFSGGNNYLMFHLLSGSTVILYPTLFSVSELVDAVRHYSADFLFAVPTVLRWLLDMDNGGGPLLPQLRVLVTGTAPISGDEKRAVARHISPNFYEVYSTSVVGQIAYLRPQDLASHGDSVGRINPLVEVEIVDEANRPLAGGATGILRCRASGACASYFGNPDQAEFSEKMVDGWCYTGDLVRLDADGYLHVEGRIDDLIIRGGINVQPGVIEQALVAHPGVKEAAVKGRPSPKLGQEPVAYVIMSEETSIPELLSWCRSQLAPHELPVEIRPLEQLPKTASGKVRKRDLPD
jgi:acyl-coenzyme A synthetase/AMP-(fatty) acid ligase